MYIFSFSSVWAKDKRHCAVALSRLLKRLRVKWLSLCENPPMAQRKLIGSYHGKPVCFIGQPDHNCNYKKRRFRNASGRAYIYKHILVTDTNKRKHCRYISLSDTILKWLWLFKFRGYCSMNITRLLYYKHYQMLTLLFSFISVICIRGNNITCNITSCNLRWGGEQPWPWKTCWGHSSSVGFCS